MAEDQLTNSRRNFIKTTATSIAALTVLPSHVIAGLGHPSPSGSLNIAAIGVGGVGFRNLNNLRNENIVALCDVDWDYGQKAFRRWANAKKYTDFRKMLETEKSIDAVVIATPDHTHAIAAITAMQLGKHVYVQSPMARSVFEIRRLVETSKIYDIVSQVGNQIASSDMSRSIAEVFWAGIIGEVRDVYAWTSEPEWKQGELLSDKKMKIPQTLDWDLFVGPSAFQPYHEAYTPYGWRAWWNFGSGVPGSVAPHILEPVFRALKLKPVSAVEASSTFTDLDIAPKAEKIRFEFNRRDNLPKVSMPPVTIHWYDGGLMPDLPGELPSEITIGSFSSGLIFHGSEGMIIADPIQENYFVVKDGVVIQPETTKIIHRIENSSLGHEADWVRACKEPSGNRLQCSANFESQQALSETIQVGNMAVRMQSLKRKLQWDSTQLTFSNIDIFEEFENISPSDFTVKNGLAEFTKTAKKQNAARFVDQAVRPIYREGWKQI